jgi:Tfp pilus assembly protein FimT
MALPKISIRSESGFTLIELIVIVAMVAVLFSSISFFSSDVYRGFIFRSDRNLAISALQKARSQAVSNIDQTSHGVHYDSGANCTGVTQNPCYIIFEGNTFTPGAASNEILTANKGITVSWTDVFFNQLDGGITTPPGSPFHLSDIANHSSDITLNNAGQIAWTH